MTATAYVVTKTVVLGIFSDPGAAAAFVSEQQTHEGAWEYRFDITEQAKGFLDIPTEPGSVFDA